MGTDVEHTSGHIQTAVTTPSTATTSGPKTSMFTKKSGFVIPKNKLSGSLVPVFRGTKKGDSDSVNEEATNQVRRKTKWGPDLTLDSNVRKGRALAYQARLNQISQQLTLGTLAMEENQDPLSTSEIRDEKSSHHQLSPEKLEMLEFERREIIGEILKLNPSYKTPADYKPLLKETNVSIPIKEYPGYNFIGLIFGPSSDTQKRLEKETGAKIRVYGTKADKGGKFEVAPTDGKEIDIAYEDLYVHVSADTFEKIDAAVALIELLVTPVSVNSLSTSTSSTSVSDGNVITGLTQGMPSSFVAPALNNQGKALPYAGPLPPSSHGHLHYSQSWFPAGPIQTPIFPESGLVTLLNSSASLLGIPARVSSSSFNPSNMPFGPRTVIPESFSSVSQNPSFLSSRPPHPSPPPYMQQKLLLSQTGGPGNTPQAAFSDRPLPFAGESSRWLQSPVSTSASQDVTNIMPMTPPLVPSPGNNAMASQNMIMSLVPRVNINNSMISPISGSSQSTGAPGGHPIGSLTYGATSQPQRSFSPLLPLTASESIPSAIHSSSIGPIQPAVPPIPTMHASSPNLVPGSTPVPFLVTSSASLPQSGIPNSVPGSALNFDSMKPLSNIPRPQHPSSSDFTFQPHRPQNTAPQVSWQNSQPVNHNLTPPIQTGLAPLAPQSPLIRPAMHNLNPSHVQGFPRPQVSHQMSQPRAHISMNLVGGPGALLVPPRHLALPGHNTLSWPTVQHMQPRNFIPPQPIVNSAGPFPPRAVNQMNLQQSHSPGATPLRFPSPHPRFSNHAGKPFSSGAQQTYDPFSPTSATLNPHLSGNAAKLSNESDPEYEDLMASVGVK